MSALDLTDVRLANQIAVAIYDRLAEKDRDEPYIEPTRTSVRCSSAGATSARARPPARHRLHGPELHPSGRRRWPSYCDTPGGSMRRTIRASDVTPKPPPTCPDCGQPMVNYARHRRLDQLRAQDVHRAGGWFKDDVHVSDDEPLTGERAYAAIRERWFLRGLTRALGRGSPVSRSCRALVVLAADAGSEGPGAPLALNFASLAAEARVDGGLTPQQIGHAHAVEMAREVRDAG